MATAKTKKKSSHKMDGKLFAGTQPHEVNYIVRKYKKYGITRKVVLEVASHTGRSHKTLYEGLLDYVLNNGFVNKPDVSAHT